MTIPLISTYMHWLHTRWPAGTVEKLPVVNDDGSTNVSGLWVVGDLTGVPLLKFSADTGAKVVQKIAKESKKSDADDYDVIIIGGGVSGVSAAIEAKKEGLNYLLLEASERFSTIINFPKKKPIYTYPVDMKPAGEMQFREEVHPKETLLEDLDKQAESVEIEKARATHVRRTDGRLQVHLADDKGAKTAQHVIVAIGRSGNFRKLGVEGENLGKVYNRLHDPKEFSGKDVMVVGGGDSALEVAIALAQCGARVTMSYRKAEFSRPKPDNLEKLDMLARGEIPSIESPTSERQTTSVGAYMGKPEMGSIELVMPSQLEKITDDKAILLDKDDKRQELKNDAVFAMIGREAPLDFFRKSNVRIHGERTTWWWISLIAFLIFCIWMYHWKKEGVHITGIASVDSVLDVGAWWRAKGWFPYNLAAWLGSLGGAWNNKAHLLGVLHNALGQPGFYYSFAYCSCVVIFGIDRVRRRPTPYIKKQTMVLAIIQIIPLFILPYLILPWMGHNGWFATGTTMGNFADHFFESYDAVGHDRAYWRSFGIILAWPLFFYNVFTDQPMWGWLIVSFIQTCVLIPGLIYFFGKGVYCGWICSCGALAETLGDRHRTKMPHGPFWNRFNMVGQVILAFALILLALRIIGWISPNSFANRSFHYLYETIPFINYKWFVDLLWAGILGVGLYFWFSGRFWCRFACPLAALMHIYARFSKFGIIADKKKCISCNVCTSVCHQGIDVMSFANKGLAMQDPQCVRCSACVVNCPTGVLTFGMVDGNGTEIRRDKTPASFVQMSVNGRKL